MEEAFQHMKFFSEALRGCDFASRYLARGGIDNDIEGETTRLTMIIQCMTSIDDWFNLDRGLKENDMENLFIQSSS